MLASSPWRRLVWSRNSFLVLRMDWHIRLSQTLLFDKGGRAEEFKIELVKNFLPRADLVFHTNN